MIEDMVMKMRKADDEYRDSMREALDDLNCLRDRLVAVLDGVDSFEAGLDSVKFESEAEEKIGKRKRR